MSAFQRQSIDRDPTAVAAVHRGLGVRQRDPLERVSIKRKFMSFPQPGRRPIYAKQREARPRLHRHDLSTRRQPPGVDTKNLDRAGHLASVFRSEMSYETDVKLRT